MQVGEWMHHPVQVIKPLDNIEHARTIMVDQKINQIPVVVDEELVGIVTDRDLRDAYPSVFDIVRSWGQPDDGLTHPEQVDVEAVMTRDVVSVRPSDSLAEVADLMRKERFGSVPVVEEGRLVGILTRSDVLAAFVSLSEKSAAA
jgi:acetoin utilization protein AcuB